MKYVYKILTWLHDSVIGIVLKTRKVLVPAGKFSKTFYKFKTILIILIKVKTLYTCFTSNVIDSVKMSGVCLFVGKKLWIFFSKIYVLCWLFLPFLITWPTIVIGKLLMFSFWKIMSWTPNFWNHCLHIMVLGLLNAD